MTNRTKKHIIWQNVVKCENLAVFVFNPLPCLLAGLFIGRKTCRRHHVEQADARTLSIVKIRATARHTHTCAMVGLKCKQDRAHHHNVVMAAHGASYALQSWSVTVIYAKSA